MQEDDFKAEKEYVAGEVMYSKVTESRSPKSYIKTHLKSHRPPDFPSPYYCFAQ